MRGAVAPPRSRSCAWMSGKILREESLRVFFVVVRAESRAPKASRLSIHSKYVHGWGGPAAAILFVGVFRRITWSRPWGDTANLSLSKCELLRFSMVTIAAGDCCIATCVSGPVHDCPKPKMATRTATKNNNKEKNPKKKTKKKT